MKTLKIAIIALFFSLSIPVTSNAMVTKSYVAGPVGDSASDAKVAAQIVQRVYEIQNMDKTNLTPDQKKSLRQELKQMKSTADGLNRGVYLSVGAVIIILLILILILR